MQGSRIGFQKGRELNMEQEQNDRNLILQLCMSNLRFQTEGQSKIISFIIKALMLDQNESTETKSKLQLPKGRGSFISKLTEIMKVYPQVIHWTEDGSQIKISDVKMMESEIIPAYYRHSNINSFVRQLNMYYFSKLETEDKNEMLFKNESFKKGNENNFYLIQRRNKGRDEMIHKIHDKFSPALDRIRKHKNLSDQAKDMLTASIEYQQIAIKNLEKIKNNISTLSNHMKNTRSKQIKQTIDRLKSFYSLKIGELIENGKKIDEFIKNSLCTETNNSRSYNSQASIDFPEKPIHNKGNELLSFKNLNFPSECSIFNKLGSYGEENEGEDEQNQVSFENFKDESEHEYAGEENFDYPANNDSQ